MAKDVFEKMFASGRSAAEIVEREGLGADRRRGRDRRRGAGVLDANAEPVAQYRAGKQQTFGFLVGKVIKETKGKANPGSRQRLLRRLLSEDVS